MVLQASINQLWTSSKACKDTEKAIIIVVDIEEQRYRRWALATIQAKKKRNTLIPALCSFTTIHSIHTLSCNALYFTEIHISDVTGGLVKLVVGLSKIIKFRSKQIVNKVIDNIRNCLEDSFTTICRPDFCVACCLVPSGLMLHETIVTVISTDRTWSKNHITTVPLTRRLFWKLNLSCRFLPSCPLTKSMFDLEKQQINQKSVSKIRKGHTAVTTRRIMIEGIIFSLAILAVASASNFVFDVGAHWNSMILMMMVFRKGLLLLKVRSYKTSD